MAVAGSFLLPVGAPVREATRRAVIALALTALVFSVFAIAAKDGSSFRAAVPWQDDPYDVVVSFTLFFVPLATGLMLLRVLLCRRFAPLPITRLVGVQRAGNVLLVAVAVTVVADWLAVVAGGARVSWTSATPIAIVGLAIVSAITLIAASLQVRAVRGRALLHISAAGPDWLDDGQLLLEAVARRVDPRLAGLARRAAAGAIDGRLGIRRHAGAAVAIVSIVFGLTLAVAEARSEGGGPANLRLIVLFTTIGAAGMAAFLAIVGRYLQLIRSDSEGRSDGLDLGLALTIGAASIPLTVAFRDQLTAASGGLVGIRSPEDLLLWIAVIAPTASTLTLLLQVVRQRRRGH